MWLWFGPMFVALNVAVFSPALVDDVTTLSVAVGAVVPMPTFVLALAKFTPLMLPKTSELLCDTWARAPMAVALNKGSEARSAWSPIIVLEFPVLFLAPASPPKKELEPPV